MLQQRIDALTDELRSLSVIERRSHARDGFFVVCDLDGFKRAQDAHPDGHAYGDRILREFARFLLDITREDEDRVSARFGGDEFIVWVPSVRAALEVERRVQGWRRDTITCTAALGKNLESADRRLMAKKRNR